MEAEENTQRKAFTPTEAEAIASAIEAALKPVAQERRKETQGRPKTGAESAPVSQSSGADTAYAETAPKTRDVAAQAVGYSHGTISKVRKVKELAEDGGAPESARSALAEMDATGSATGPHQRVMRAVEAEA